MDHRLKMLFYETARQEALLHLQLCPDFKITPRKSETIPRRRPNNATFRVTVDADVENSRVRNVK